MDAVVIRECFADRLQATAGLCHRPENSPPLVHGFFPFIRRDGVRDNAGTSLDVQDFIPDDGCPDGDCGIHVAGPADVADCAGINSPLDRLQLTSSPSIELYSPFPTPKYYFIIILLTPKRRKIRSRTD